MLAPALHNLQEKYSSQYWCMFTDLITIIADSYKRHETFKDLFFDNPYNIPSGRNLNYKIHIQGRANVS
jgi:hypothetical protein